MGTFTHTEPFGVYALPPTRERIRVTADAYADTRLGHWRISLARKRAIKGLSEPFDVSVAPGVKVRLYPSGNRCEKRAMAGVQIWDSLERAALRQAVQASDGPFVFLDVGANAGLYSLFVNAYAHNAKRETRIIAIEPSDEMAARLTFNATASGASIELIRSAISDEPGTAYLSGGDSNKGEAQLSDTGEPVTVETLAGLCERLNLTHITAMKLDIEGHDERALRAFFQDASAELHPKLIIAETAQGDGPIVEMAASQNYFVADATALNVILKKR